jgi:hypothetical protein
MLNLNLTNTQLRLMHLSFAIVISVSAGLLVRSCSDDTNIRRNIGLILLAILVSAMVIYHGSHLMKQSMEQLIVVIVSLVIVGGVYCMVVKY